MAPFPNPCGTLPQLPPPGQRMYGLTPIDILISDIIADLNGIISPLQLLSVLLETSTEERVYGIPLTDELTECGTGYVPVCIPIPGCETIECCVGIDYLRVQGNLPLLFRIPLLGSVTCSPTLGLAYYHSINLPVDFTCYYCGTECPECINFTHNIQFQQTVNVLNQPIIRITGQIIFECPDPIVVT